MPRVSRLSAALAVLLASGLPNLASTSHAAGPQIRVHQYATTNWSWGTNAYWLESDTGIVVIDGLLLTSDAKAMAAAIASTGKPLVAILLTHPHADHFGGIPTLRAELGEAPVLATQATADAVAPLFRQLISAPWTQRFGADYPTEAVTPNRIVASGEIIELAGMHFTIQDMGAMETSDNAIIHNRETGALFTGDATVFGASFYVGEGHSCQSLAGLQRLRDMYPATTMTFSGHYAPMRLSVILDDNITQVRFLRRAMTEAFAEPGNRAADGSLTEETRDRLVKEVAARFADHADYGLGPEQMAGALNLPGLETEIRKEVETGQSCSAQ